MNGDGVVVRMSRDAISTGAYIGKSSAPGKHIVQLEDGRIDDFDAAQLTPMLQTFEFNQPGMALLVIEGDDGGHFLHFVKTAADEEEYRAFWDKKFGKKIVARHDLSLKPIAIQETEPRK